MPKENKQIAKTPTQAIKLFWKKGFFRSRKTLHQVAERLAQDGYNFLSSGLNMALNRAKYLTRRGKMGKHEYIQTHPFVDDEN